MRRIFAKLPMIIGLIALLLVGDVFLARKANERIAARHYDFLENYKPGEIDWDDKNWQQCWEQRELVLYKYKTCIHRANSLRAPDGVNEKLYYYYWPQSRAYWFTKLLDGLNRYPTIQLPVFSLQEGNKVSKLLPLPQLVVEGNVITNGRERFERQSVQIDVYN